MLKINNFNLIQDITTSTGEYFASWKIRIQGALLKISQWAAFADDSST